MFGGGAERTFVTIANGLAQAGFSVTFALNSDVENYSDEIDDMVEIVHLARAAETEYSSKVMDIQRRARALIALTRYLFSNRPDCVVAALPESIINAAIANILSGRKSRLIASQRNAFSLQHGKRGILARVNRKLVAWSLRRADSIVAPSRGVAIDLIEEALVSAEKVLVINNPVIDGNFVKKSNQEIDDPWFDSSLKKFIFVGRLTRVKRVHDIIQAFAKVIEQKPALLAIVGDGPLRNELEQLAKDLGIWSHVKFFGIQSNPYRFMKASDCLVLASEHEGFPNVLVQSMAVGTQVISSDCKFGPSEILDNGNFGLLFRVGDLSQLEQQMNSLFKKQIEKTKIVERANLFGWPQMEERWVNLLKSDIKD